ncbi:MAG TPA: POTRA domain-containing protein [Polyangiaceae bacterium]|jgi:outer membrane protein assembly factor BamA
MRVPVSIACCLCALGLASGPANAQTVTPIPPPATPLPPPSVPTIEPAPDLSALVGKPVTRVAVVLEGNVWDDVEVPPVLTVKAGEAFTPAVARRALDELLTSGDFARGRVSATAENKGVLLVVHVVPRKLVKRVEMDLHGARVDYEEILREAGLSEGGELVGAEIADVAMRIDRDMTLHGYPAAHATVQTRATDDPTRTFVLVDVVPGAPRVVDERDFYVFGGDRGQILPVTSAYTVKVHDRADSPAIDSADTALEQALHAKGWYRAHVTHDMVWIGTAGPGQRVALRVRIDAGPLQVAQFEGNDHYDAGALGAALGLDTETDRSASHLADKLRIFYEKRGFLDAEVRPEVRGGEKDGVVLPVEVLMFHIDEHRRVRVSSRRYPCLKLDAVRHLSSGGPRSSAEIGTEIDSFLDEELPGTQLLVGPNPEGLSQTIGAGAESATGARPIPLKLDPDIAYVADTYDRATEHVQELYRNEGFLHATVGPVQRVRAQCDARSPPGRCIPKPLPPLDSQACTYDTSGIPLPTQPLDSSYTCRPDPAHGVECAPDLQLVIPIKLGPRTQLWDVAFTGLKSVSEKEVAEAALVPLGDFVSTTKLDDARRRIVDWYKERGYWFVDVKYALEPSLDNSRARVRFDVSEGDQVFVSSIVVHGLESTRESVVRRRIALVPGEPFRASDVRKTQERLATLGVFSSISVTLTDPYVPAPSKVVIIDVVERPPQYIEPKVGFSTGEGVRGTLEYGHRNLLGYAWSLIFHVQASYLPNFLILDPQVKQNYVPLGIDQRIATRDTVTLAWPEMGLGPNVLSQVDGVFVRDLEPDFILAKTSALGSMTWRPQRGLQLSGGPDYEHNDVTLFDAQTILQYLQNNPGNADLARLLRVPDGASNVFAYRAVFTWDRRDSPFNAHKGTYIALGAEQANFYPVEGSNQTPELANNQYEGHILRMTQTLAAYIPITPKVSIAAEVRFGEVANIVPCRAPFAQAGVSAPGYCTYPDRQFFMGGVDSMRGWLQDAFIPQDYADAINAGKFVCPNQSNCQVPLRGANFMINPRLEARFPVKAPLDAAIFADMGNSWSDPSYILTHGMPMRADVGAGIRLLTPVGPLVFDYGINVTKKSYEDFGAFHFAIGLF